jgi:hypothetical protein
MIALEDFRRYLINATSSFEIWTDHANLQYFKELQDYCFTLHHVAGKTNS